MRMLLAGRLFDELDARLFNKDIHSRVEEIVQLVTVQQLRSEGATPAPR